MFVTLNKFKDESSKYETMNEWKEVTVRIVLNASDINKVWAFRKHYALVQYDLSVF